MDPYHYPPDLIAQLIDAIPALCRSKRDVLSFFKQAGVPENLYADFAVQIRTPGNTVRKREMATTIIERLNEGGDALLGPRRQLIKRVLDFEDFSHCYPEDVAKAKAAVGDIRKTVNVKDTFTRMKDEKEAQELARRREREHQMEVQKKRRLEREARLGAIKADLFALFPMTDAQRRGKLLEGVLNRLFKEFGISIREAFTVTGSGGEGIIEQIDGAIELDGHVYLVEMKWWTAKLGAGDAGQHMARILGRPDARGIFISNSGFTDAMITQCTTVLPKLMCVLCELEEIVLLLERGEDLQKFLREKIRALTLDRNPLHRPLKR